MQALAHCYCAGVHDESYSVRFGRTAAGRQRWLCRICGRTFVNSAAEPGHLYAEHDRRAAIAAYEYGLSVQIITAKLQTILSRAPSEWTVRRWLREAGIQLRKPRRKAAA